MENKGKYSIILIIIYSVLCIFIRGSTKEVNSLDNKGIIFFIAKTGKDDNSGTIDKPFASLEGARDAIRKLKNTSELLQGGITVYLLKGVYYRNKSFNLSNIDSGDVNLPIVYKAYKNEKVFISGGIKLDNKKFTKVTDLNILNKIDRLLHICSNLFTIQDGRCKWHIRGIDKT